MQFPLNIKNLFPRAFSLVKYNLVLFIPFLLFLLIMGFVLLPLSAAGGGPLLLFILVALFAVFLSGWLNMFKKCLDNAENENLTSEQRTINSFELFKEFFPGVGNYFVKIFFGILIYFFLFNILLLSLKMVFIPDAGIFESFTREEMAGAFQGVETTSELTANISAFTDKISDADKLKIIKTTILELIFTVLFTYLTMLWFQIIAIKDTFPIKALIKSVSIVIKDPLNTFIIYSSTIILFLAVYFIGGILLVLSPGFLGPIFQLFIIILFVYTVVFFLMVTFLYFEKYTNQEKINSNSRSDSVGQD